ncbi:hypothetical protein FH972_024132 [Carpinus fangiana]|uniref:DUF7704 domain-containing protein n=1 Tax=Carpinus fangiana TaxID=176857 RepID=A0A5N6KX63_9ROSI|nr:hypothetical protein FH972_024132 [Carpinus fangiana]
MLTSQYSHFSYLNGFRSVLHAVIDFKFQKASVVACDHGGDLSSYSTPCLHCPRAHQPLDAEPPHPLFPTEHVMAMQMGNLYLLACMIGLAVLYTTTEARVAHAYIWALWIADIGHVGVTAWAMGWRQVTDIAGYNSMAWGNIGATVFLFATRTAYLIGLLGQDRLPVNQRKKGR